MDARELPEVFAESEVDRIYLNFSDPWPKSTSCKTPSYINRVLSRYEKSSHRKDLWSSKRTTPLFRLFSEQVKEAGWTLQAFTYDLHHNKELNKENIMTEYEEKFSSKETRSIN